MTQIQECGTCKWFKLKNECFGWCEFILPKLPLYIPIQRGAAAQWRNVAEDDGEGCLTYEVRDVLKKARV